MQRVLHVTSGNLYGGIERILVTLASGRALAPMMRPQFAFCFEGRPSGEVAASRAPVRQLAPVRARNPLSVWRARRRLDELLARERFDVVVCHGSWVHAMFALLVRRRRLPLAFWLHSSTNARHWTERWASRTLPDLLICVSHVVASTAPSLFPGVQPHVVYAPRPLDAGPQPGTRDAVRPEFGVAADAVVIIQAGRMEPLEGQTLLIDALARLRDVPRWRRLLVGGVQLPSGERYFRQLQTRVRDAGLESRIHFLAQRSEVPGLLSAADVFCQLNQWSEGLSIVWLDAGLAALPIVTMRLGTAPESIGEDAGILLPPEDAAALAGAIERLIRDPHLRRRLGLGAAERVQRLCDPATRIAKLAALPEVLDGPQTQDAHATVPGETVESA